LGLSYRSPNYALRAIVNALSATGLRSRGTGQEYSIEPASQGLNLLPIYSIGIS
jgi:hypothetical protein